MNYHIDSGRIKIGPFDFSCCCFDDHFTFSTTYDAYRSGKYRSFTREELSLMYYDGRIYGTDRRLVNATIEFVTGSMPAGVFADFVEEYVSENQCPAKVDSVDGLLRLLRKYPDSEILYE